MHQARLEPFLLRSACSTGQKIGGGSYGTVEQLEVDGLICAGKKLHEILAHPDNPGVENILEKFVEECTLLADLRHPNIVQFLGVCFLGTSDPDLPVLVMEFLSYCLDTVLEGGEEIPLEIQRSILADVARGLLYLHNRDPPVIHRDLTAKNVLLNSAMTAKIADLGVARMLNLPPARLVATMTKTPGTMAYMPPEAMDLKPQYNTTIDIFSFGHLALYTLVQEFPYPSAFNTMNRSGILVARTEVQRRFNQMQQLYRLLGGERHPLVQLVTLCLDNDPMKRPSARQLLTQLETVRFDCRYERMSKLELIRAVKERETSVQELQGQLADQQGEVTDLQATVRRLTQENDELQTAMQRMSLKHVPNPSQTASARDHQPEANNRHHHSQTCITHPPLFPRGAHEQSTFPYPPGLPGQLPVTYSHAGGNDHVATYTRVTPSQPATTYTRGTPSQPATTYTRVTPSQPATTHTRGTSSQLATRGTPSQLATTYTHGTPSQLATTHTRGTPSQLATTYTRGTPSQPATTYSHTAHGQHVATYAQYVPGNQPQVLPTKERKQLLPKTGRTKADSLEREQHLQELYARFPDFSDSQGEDSLMYGEGRNSFRQELETTYEQEEEGSVLSTSVLQNLPAPLARTREDIGRVAMEPSASSASFFSVNPEIKNAHSVFDDDYGGPDISLMSRPLPMDAKSAELQHNDAIIKKWLEQMSGPASLTCETERSPPDSMEKKDRLETHLMYGGPSVYEWKEEEHGKGFPAKPPLPQGLEVMESERPVPRPRSKGMPVTRSKTMDEPKRERSRPPPKSNLASKLVEASSRADQGYVYNPESKETQAWGPVTEPPPSPRTSTPLSKSSPKPRTRQNVPHTLPSVPDDRLSNVKPATTPATLPLTRHKDPQYGKSRQTTGDFSAITEKAKIYAEKLEYEVVERPVSFEQKYWVCTYCMNHVKKPLTKCNVCNENKP